MNTRDGNTRRLDELSRADVVTLADVLCTYVRHPESRWLGPDGKKRQAHTRGLLQRMTIRRGLHHPIGKEVSRFEQGKDDFIEIIDDMCIRYDCGRVAANEAPIAEISEHKLRISTKQTGLDRRTMRAILRGDKVRDSTLAKPVIGLRNLFRENS